MADYGATAARLLAVLHSVPLWLFIALALAGYGALFLPTFGGADTVELRRQWATCFWLEAIVSTIFALVCAVDLVVKALTKSIKTRSARRRRLLRQRYFEVYNPLVEELLKIHITTSSSAAPRLKVRLQDAWEELRRYRRWRVCVRNAVRTALNNKGTDPHGEVDFGGDFPIALMWRLVRQNLSYCDEQLIDFVGRSWSQRIETQIAPDALTADDVRLWDHIHNEHRRLKQAVLP